MAAESPDPDEPHESETSAETAEREKKQAEEIDLNADEDAVADKACDEMRAGKSAEVTPEPDPIPPPSPRSSGVA